MASTVCKIEELVQPPDLNQPATERLQLLVLTSNSQSKIIKIALGNQYDVVVADNFERTMHYLYQYDFALIVAYPDALGKSGPQCVAQLKASQLASDIPVIVVLPRQASDEEVATIEAGALDCLIMPFSPTILTAKIHNHMQTAERIKQLEIASCTDGLTGLHNRVQLETVLLREWFNARRAQHFMSALMIDVDYFKQFNDTHGHLIGDQCLRAVASIVQQTRRRKSDFAARYGGEEFVMLLPFTDETGAIKLAQSLLEAVREQVVFTVGQEQKPVTVSIGVASVKPHTMGDESDNPWLLIEQADKKLYQAKQSGRNRFCS